jgi:hypothetical protein
VLPADCRPEGAHDRGLSRPLVAEGLNGPAALNPALDIRHMACPAELDKMAQFLAMSSRVTKCSWGWLRI